jgi:hypothetical protein
MGLEVLAETAVREPLLLFLVQASLMLVAAAVLLQQEPLEPVVLVVVGLVVLPLREPLEPLTREAVVGRALGLAQVTLVEQAALES